MFLHAAESRWHSCKTFNICIRSALKIISCGHLQRKQYSPFLSLTSDE